MNAPESPWIDYARRDYKRGALYATALPPRPSGAALAYYRVGWIMAEIEANASTASLPAYFAETERGGYLWIATIHNGRPVYQFTRGETPLNGAGYGSVKALLSLKNDSIRNR